jgi:hypothetical protein
VTKKGIHLRGPERLPDLPGTKIGTILQPEDLNADFDSSGHVGAEDAARIAWYYVGKIHEL